MAASVEKLEGLKRKLVVTVGAEEVDKAYQEKLKEVAHSAQIPGFRPGKVPTHVIKQKMGESIKNDIANSLIQNSFQQAITENKIHMAGQPTSFEGGDLIEGKPLNYTVHFETYPDIELADMKDVKLERAIIEVQDEDIDAMIEKLRKQQAKWDPVERGAQIGDRVIIDFEGTIKGEPFEHGDAKDFQLEIGSNNMIPGFEEGLVDQKVDEIREVKLSFPKDYPAKEVAGKKAVFKVTLKKVMEPKLPEMNDEFAKNIGLKGGLAVLRDEVKKSMEAEITKVVKQKLKKSVLDQLVSLNTVEVPLSLINEEISHLQKMSRQEMVASGKSKEEVDKMELPKEPYMEQAKHRVVLGLLLGEVIKKHQLKMDSTLVQQKLAEIASVYPEPDQVIKWYQNNKSMMSEVESVVLEDQAVDKLLEQVTVEERVVSYEEAMNPSNDDSSS